MLTKGFSYAENIAMEAAAETTEKEFLIQPLPAELTNTVLYTAYRPRSFCFTGGKGGVGKTTLLLCVADYLRKKNYQVRIIDCDPLPKTYRQATNKLSRTNERNVLPNGAVVYTLLSKNVEYETFKYDLQAKPFAESLYTYGELNALAKQVTRAGGGGDTVLKLFTNLNRLAQKELTADSVILYDCPAGLEFTGILPYFLATHFLLITNPESPALQDAAGVVKVIAQNKQMAKNIYPVINKVPVKDKKILPLARQITTQTLSNLNTLFAKWSGTASRTDFVGDAIYIDSANSFADINTEQLGQKILALLRSAERH
ncbi:MAG: AAA family ATPase [Candidatus Margulisbacteria bacterium]|jgi:MinD-like ATPase involved in chromosome partitioning or flagellar assembly|nr:AAA family ATPase [Candidatus Margulisiibacteriota bacterium]